MEDKFAEDLALLVCFAKRMEIVAHEMQNICTEMLESLQVYLRGYMSLQIIFIQQRRKMTNGC